VLAWGRYGGILKRAIAVMKYENQPQIARPLGQWLAQAWLDLPRGSQKIVVVPIPLHASKQKKRGYNQAALIAKSFCETTGLKLKLNGLERIRETEAQYTLSAPERAKNLAQAFALGKDFHHHNRDTQVLLIDDLYTTGATANSAVTTLRHAGIVVLGIAATAIAIKDKQTQN
jgi:ComF family protein